tara:strand:+ start:3095 stop:4357 length:1263 start_codon:yes stop_codon:yes gene_type:complete
MNLQKEQKSFYTLVKTKYLRNTKISELNFINYLSISNKLSYNFLLYKQNSYNFLFFLICYFKNFFSIFFYNNYIVHKKKITKSNFDKVIITWGVKENFNKSGHFFDKYSGLKSFKEKNILWIVQYNQKDLPSKIAENIIIFKQGKKKNIICILLKIFKESKTVTDFFQSLSFNSFYAVDFYYKINKEINNIFFSSISMPYEGQPFQKFFIKKFKNKKIKIEGLIHTFLQPIPFNIFYSKSNSPDFLIVSSLSQKNCLVKFMNWSKESILIKKSKRYSRIPKIEMKKKIFLPYQINNSLKLYRIFEKFIHSNKKYSLPKFEIKIHPVKVNNFQHENFKNQIYKTLNLKKKYDNKKNISIFLDYTSAIIEALERGVNIFQICTNPILHVYTPFFWKGIKVKKISSYSFEYMKIKKNTLIKMN